MARSRSNLASADTSLLLRVEIPAAGFDFLLKFSVKPGAALSRVQTATAETLDELAARLEGDLIEAGRCSKDLYQVAKMECEHDLQDWQAKLSQATAANLRADRARSELTRMRDSYLREVAGLRQQLVRKQQAEERGAEFVPDIISHFSVASESAGEVDGLLEEQKKQLEEQHRSEVERLTRENQDLLYKLKTKAMQANLQGELLAKRMEGPEQLNAATQTMQEKRESKATETVSVETISCEVQTLDNMEQASTHKEANAESEEVEVDDLDCLDLDIMVTTMDVPEASRSASRRKSPKTRTRSGSLATNDSEVARRPPGRARSSSRDLSGSRKPAAKKRPLDRESSVSDCESRSTVGPDMIHQNSASAVDVDTSDRGIQTSLDAQLLQAAEEVLAGRLAKPEIPVSPRWRQGQDAPLRRTKAVSMSTQVDPTMLGVVEVQEPLEPRELREVKHRRPWTQGFDTPASAFPAFSTEDDSLLFTLQNEQLDSDDDQEEQALPWKHVKTAPGNRQMLPELKSPSKKTAVTLPAQDDLSGPLLFSVSSQGHSAAMVSRTEGARPSQRTISRPKLSQNTTPSPRARFNTGG